MKDADPVNAIIFERDLDFIRRRYEYLIARRDTLINRVRFGLLALNGAFLAGVLTVMSTGPLAKGVGLDATHARYSCAAFVLGLALSGIAVIIDSNQFRLEAGDAYAHQSSLSMLAATYERDESSDAIARTGEALAHYHGQPLIDFQYSPVSIACQNFSGGSWLVGILIPLAAAFGWG